MSIFAVARKSDPIVPFLPVGGLIDIPTGAFVKGHKGQLICNGGVAPISGVVGKPHMFKSTIAKSMIYIAALRLLTTIKTSVFLYDTEITVVEEHQREVFEYFMLHFDDLKEFFFKDGKVLDLINDNIVIFTNKDQYTGDEYYEFLKKILRIKDPDFKRDKGEDLPDPMQLIDTPFLDRDGVTLYKMLPPTLGDVDSITEFTTKSDDELQNEHELGDTGANPGFMTQGLNKQRFLMGLPTLLSKSNHYMMMTAQVGKAINISKGPMPSAPQKQLSAMKNDDVLKGVSSKFVSLSNVCFQALKSNPCLMTHRIEDGLRYPLYQTKGNQYDNDLFEVELLCIRNKNGPTGWTITILVSQSKGFLSDLTEFHYIRTNDFGFKGTRDNYQLVLLPELNLSRTTIRKKLENTPGLQRAINITSEMLQIQHFKPGWWQQYSCTPEELYEGLKAKGYDWNEILLKTRGWYSLDINHPIKELSTIDLMRMLKDEYFPHWMDPVTKRIKQ
jgi:hypothetical protein